MGANPDQCRLISTTFFSPYILCNIFSETLLCLKNIFFSIVYFSTQRNTLFSLTRMVTNYLLFVVKIFVCALCCANLFFGFSFSLISRTEQISTLYCNTKIVFAILLETRVSLKKHYFLLLVHVDSCLFCGRNDTDVGRGSSVGVKPSHFLFLLLFLFSLSSLPFFTIVFFFVFFFYCILCYLL